MQLSSARFALQRVPTLLAAGALFIGTAVPVTATPQTPDVIVYDLGVRGNGSTDIAFYGQANGIVAYSFATQSCNQGTAELAWYDGNGDTRHPVISQNMFRYKDGRFEQLGQSWLKHGRCGVNEVEAGCGTCISSSCDTLGVGCADTYTASTNDGRYGRSKTLVHPTLGTHIDGSPGPSGDPLIRGRLQVAVADMTPALNVGAQYFIEGQYVAADDAAAGAGGNNASYRNVLVNSLSDLVVAGETVRGRPAIYAWKDMDPKVRIRLVVSNESGRVARYFLGYRVTRIGPHQWRYEYAIQNQDSDRGAGSFSLTVAPEAAVTSIGFHDVPYHSGDPYDDADWQGGKTGGEIRWATTAFSSDPNANALRWGTLYNFGFVSNHGPGPGEATIGLFKPRAQLARATIDAYSSVVNDGIVVPGVLVPLQPRIREAGEPESSGHGQQLSTTSRRGARGNTSQLTELASPVIGQNWRVRAHFAGPSQTALFVSARGAATGPMTRMGEVLIARPFSSHHGRGDHTLAIPHDAALVGVRFSAQAAVLTENGWKLSNALDAVILD